MESPFHKDKGLKPSFLHETPGSWLLPALSTVHKSLQCICINRSQDGATVINSSSHRETATDWGAGRRYVGHIGVQGPRQGQPAALAGAETLSQNLFSPFLPSPGSYGGVPGVATLPLDRHLCLASQAPLPSNTLRRTTCVMSRCHSLIPSVVRSISCGSLDWWKS